LATEDLPSATRQDVALAVGEYLQSLRSRADDGFAHYNLGNYYAQHAQLDKALACYEVAGRLRPDSVLPLVNASLVHNRLGQNDQAEACLRKSLVLEPKNAVAQLNLGMLLAEMNRPSEAEGALRSAVAGDPKSAQGAYNLGMILAANRPEEALTWLEKAHDLDAAEPRYAYALAFYLNDSGQAQEAAAILEPLVSSGAASAAVYALLGDAYQGLGKSAEAARVYRQAIQDDRLTGQERSDFVARLRTASPP
jgi:tetratricopeptide (TPR) repeat protein